MEMNWFRALMTVIWMVLFLGIAWWAYSPKQKKRFDEASRLALDDTQPSNDKNAKESSS